MRFLNILFVLTSVLCCNCLAGHEDVKILKLERISNKDGLSQGMVNAILQDQHGFMWFGTKDGLNRYDGKQFTVFRHDVNDLQTIADNYIKSLYEDRKGRLWVGTASHGLDLFDPEREIFTHVLPPSVQDVQLNRQLINMVIEDKAGNYYVATGKHLIYLKEQNRSSNKISSFTMTIIDTGFFELYKQKNGVIWVLNKTGDCYTIPNSEKHPTQRQYIRLSHEQKNKSKLLDPNVHIETMLEDTIKKQLWLGTRSSFYLYDLATQQVVSKINYPGDPVKNMAKSMVRVNQRLWFIREHELMIFEPVISQLYRTASSTESKNNLLKSVSCVYADKTGNIWIGTTGHGVLKFYPRTEQFHPVESTSLRGIQSITPHQLILYDFSPDLKWYDPITQQSGIFTKNKSVNNYALSGPLRIENKQGLIWYCIDSTLFCIDQSGHELQRISIPVNQASKVTLKFVQCIFPGLDESIWIGTTNGLYNYHPKTAKWKHFIHSPNDPNSLSFNTIFCICADPLDIQYLWVGTSSGGFNHFNTQTGNCKRYSSKDGLSNDVVYGILSDGSGNLWLSTNYGLNKFHPSTGTFHYFLEEDGLQSNEFNRNAYHKSDDGTLYFGGIEGFNYFNPDEIVLNHKPPRIIISGFKIRNRVIHHTDSNGVLSKPIHLTDKIALPYEDNMLTFDFAVLDFTQPKKNRYAYQLNGFDKDWIQSGTVHTATYTNLAPGTYTLYAKGSNNDHVWSTRHATLLLTILPPWYMTWWFRSLVIILLLGFIYSFYRYRLAQIIKLQQIRNDLARDLHDEVGSNLSSIYIFSNIAQRKLNSPSGEEELLLQKIKEYASASMDSMSDIVWMLNTQNDRFEKILARMRNFVAELAEAKGYDLHIQFDESLNHLELKMEDRKNFYLIYKEVINNIIKYADGKNIWISLLKTNERICLSVRDDGKGFKIPSHGQGNGLINMKKRALALKGELLLQSKPGEGTQIELKFTMRAHESPFL